MTVDELQVPQRAFGLERALPNLQFSIIASALTFSNQHHLVVLLRHH